MEFSDTPVASETRPTQGSNTAAVSDAMRRELNQSYQAHLQSLTMPTTHVSRAMLLMTQVPIHSQIAVQTHAIRSLATVLKFRDALGVPLGYVPPAIRIELSARQSRRRPSVAQSIASSGDTDLMITRIPTNPSFASSPPSGHHHIHPISSRHPHPTRGSAQTSTQTPITGTSTGNAAAATPMSPDFPPPLVYTDEDKASWKTLPKHGFGERFEHGYTEGVSLQAAKSSIDRIARILQR